MDTYGHKPSADELLHDLMRIMAPDPHGDGCEFAQRQCGYVVDIDPGRLHSIEGPIQRVTDAVKQYTAIQAASDAADRGMSGD